MHTRVLDPKLGAAISEALEIQCFAHWCSSRILRGIRHHFHALIKGLTLKACSVAQLGLGHSYSRAMGKVHTCPPSRQYDHTVHSSAGPTG
ncbi:hypothetical protein evm_008550 [Chilo suppressalis]|nr:hypothetical protein evm_008550 [Chilo suppressalis]